MIEACSAYPSGSKVALSRLSNPTYAKYPPFHPPRLFPEYPFGSETDITNEAYNAVRDCLRGLKLDAKHEGTPSWNPMSAVVQPGDTVLIKPNMITHKPTTNESWETVITHGSILRAVSDYVCIALNGRGRILITDGPQEDSNIEKIKKRLGISEIIAFLKERSGVNVDFIDLSQKHRVDKDGVYVETLKLPGDPRGNVRVNLSSDSYFLEHDSKGKRYYGAFYDIKETNAHHRDGVHEYMISRSAIEADVFISLPKLKTHKKVGVTLNLKGIVGISGQKNWLPHYAIGSPEENGDQFSSQTISRRIENSLVLRAKALLRTQNPIAVFLARKLRSVAYSIFGDTERVVRSGNWYGNDTCWRMSLDLNRALLYASSRGDMTPHRKRYFSIVDGLIGMEGNGPVAGKAKQSGLVVAGSDPVAVDVVCATLMGFDYKRIPILYRAFDKSAYKLSTCLPESIEIYIGEDAECLTIGDIQRSLWKSFEPPFGWKGQVELAP